MPASVVSDDFNDEVPKMHLPNEGDNQAYVLQDTFILDIDNIQIHGRYSQEIRHLLSIANLFIAGVGAADITKLKANGFYTIAVGAIPQTCVLRQTNSLTASTSLSTEQHARHLTRSRA
jgi:hypothetical protein